MQFSKPARTGEAFSLKSRHKRLRKRQKAEIPEATTKNMEHHVTHIRIAL